jgi:hypothetical protein
MISAFGVDHGYQDVSKLSIAPLRTFMAGAGKAAAGGAHRVPGMAAMPKPAAKLRQGSQLLGIKTSTGLKRAGAAITGSPGKRAAPSLQTRIGGAVTRMGQRGMTNPGLTGGITAGAGAGAVGAGGYGVHRFNQRQR